MMKGSEKGREREVEKNTTTTEWRTHGDIAKHVKTAATNRDSALYPEETQAEKGGKKAREIVENQGGGQVQKRKNLMQCSLQGSHGKGRVWRKACGRNREGRQTRPLSREAEKKKVTWKDR